MIEDLVCAIATDASSQYLVWFYKIDGIKEIIEDSVDDYGHYGAAGFPVINLKSIKIASRPPSRIRKWN